MVGGKPRPLKVHLACQIVNHNPLFQQPFPEPVGAINVKRRRRGLKKYDAWQVGRRYLDTRTNLCNPLLASLLQEESSTKILFGLWDASAFIRGRCCNIPCATKIMRAPNKNL
jgi:hypothetical protein